MKITYSQVWLPSAFVAEIVTIDFMRLSATSPSAASVRHWLNHWGVKVS